MSIDYPASSSPAGNNPEYKLDVGNSVWMAGGLSGGYRFPGIHIYEVEGSNNFGSTLINRGMVLRGPSAQSYNVLASLVMYNGDSGGGDGTPFWGQLTMYSPGVGNPQTVLLTSGSAASSSGALVLSDINSNTLFRAGVDGNVWVSGRLQSPAGGPVKAVALNIDAYGPVIDSTGHWVGVAIGGGASAVGPNLSIQYSNGSGAFQGSANATVDASGNIGANGRMNAVGGFEVAGSLVIDGTADAHPYAFVGTGGVNTTGGVTCGAVNGSSLSVSGALTMTGNSQSFIQTNASGVQVTCSQNGIWSGNGVQTGSDIYAGKFGISGFAVGWPQGTYGGGGGAANNTTATFTSADGKTVTVCGGLIIGIH
jgi:hypothetical protein